MQRRVCLLRRNGKAHGLARDLQRCAYGKLTGWQPDVQYSDGFRSAKGSAKVAGRDTWVREVLREPKVVSMINPRRPVPAALPRPTEGRGLGTKRVACSPPPTRSGMRRRRDASARSRCPLPRNTHVHEPRRPLRQSVTRMRMLDKGTAQIDWTATGGVAVFSGVTFSATTVVELNLLTGRVTSLK